jgi:hypothetical protein
MTRASRRTFRGEASAPGSCDLLLSTALVGFCGARLNAHDPPKKRRGRYTAPNTAEVAVEYRLSHFLQVKPQQLRCISRGRRVTNRNPGGHNGHSAMSWSLFCLRCADGLTPPAFWLLTGLKHGDS